MKSSDLESTTNHEYMRMFGDTVTGEYREDGKLIEAGQSTNPAKKEKMQKMFAMSAAMAGATLLPQANIATTEKKKPGRKVKNKQAEALPIPIPVVNEIPERMVTTVVDKPATKRHVYLHNQMGKIKMAVEDVLECDMAFCLVFPHEDSVIFTPNAGETLNFVDPSGETHSVYYADTLFSWTDSVKSLMILFKRNE